MSQILDPLPLGSTDPIACCYVNATSQIQVARITNVPNWYFERVVFPGQRLVFEALSEAQLEIHTGMMASAIISDTIPCIRLRLQLVEGIDKDCTSERPSEDVNNVNNYEPSLTNEATHASKQKVLASVD